MRGCGAKRHFQQYLNYILTVCFFWGGETGVLGENNRRAARLRAVFSGSLNFLP